MIFGSIIKRLVNVYHAKCIKPSNIYPDMDMGLVSMSVGKMVIQTYTDYGPSPLRSDIVELIGPPSGIYQTIVWFDPELDITEREDKMIHRFMDKYNMNKISFLQYWYDPDIKAAATHEYNGFGHHMHFRCKTNYTLIHETVHAWQHCKGILYRSEGGWVYRNKLYTQLDGPWEREAIDISVDFLINEAI
jgi:hypothetical protein